MTATVQHIDIHAEKIIGECGRSSEGGRSARTRREAARTGAQADKVTVCRLSLQTGV